MVIGGQSTFQPFSLPLHPGNCQWYLLVNVWIGTSPVEDVVVKRKIPNILLGREP
jgi:hypothetical protein